MSTAEMTKTETGKQLTQKVASMSDEEQRKRTQELAAKTTAGTITHDELREGVKLVFGLEADLTDETTKAETGKQLTQKIASMPDFEADRRALELAAKHTAGTITHDELREFTKLFFGSDADLAD